MSAKKEWTFQTDLAPPVVTNMVPAPAKYPSGIAAISSDTLAIVPPSTAKLGFQVRDDQGRASVLDLRLDGRRIECGRGLSPPRWFEDAGRGGPAYKERGYSFDEKTGQVAVQIVAEPLALGEHELAALAADDLGNSGLRSWKFTVKKQALPILEVDPNQDEPLKLEPWNPPLLEPPPKPEQKTPTDAREPKKPIEPTEPEVEPEPETPPALVVLRSLRSTVCLGRAIAGEPPEPPSFAGLAVGRARPQEVEAKLGPPLVVGRDATGTRVAGHDGHRFGLEAIVVRYRGEEAIEQIQLRFARPVPREDLVAVLGLGPPGERRAIEGGTVEVFAPAGIELTAGMAGVTRLSLRAP